MQFELWMARLFTLAICLVVMIRLAMGLRSIKVGWKPASWLSVAMASLLTVVMVLHGGGKGNGLMSGMRWGIPSVEVADDAVAVGGARFTAISAATNGVTLAPANARETWLLGTDPQFADYDFQGIHDGV